MKEINAIYTYLGCSDLIFFIFHFCHTEIRYYILNSSVYVKLEETNLHVNVNIAYTFLDLSKTIHLYYCFCRCYPL